jgi:hypothetical protein
LQYESKWTKKEWNREVRSVIEFEHEFGGEEARRAMDVQMNDLEDML